MRLFYRRVLQLGMLSAAVLKTAEIWSFRRSQSDRGCWNKSMVCSHTGNDLAVFSAGVVNANTVVILLHGLGNSSLSMAYLGDTLVDTGGLLVCRYDRASYGGSRRGNPEQFSITEAKRDLQTVISALNADTKRIVLIGHSLGGFIAAEFVRENKDRYDLTAVLVEPLHPQEAVKSPNARLGLTLAQESVRNRAVLAYFGGELLDASSGVWPADYKGNPYASRLRCESRTWRCLRATENELSTVARLLRDGDLMLVPEPSDRVDLITSSTSWDSPEQRSLFRSYVMDDNQIVAVPGVGHNDILLGARSVKQIVRVVLRAG